MLPNAATIGAVELHPSLHEPIDVWRLDEGMAVAGQVVVHVVHGDEEDVELPLRGGGRGGAGHNQRQTEKGPNQLHGIPAPWRQMAFDQHGVYGPILGKPALFPFTPFLAGRLPAIATMGLTF